MMMGEQLKALENRLWKGVDDLRANSKLTATEYSFPVLGIIFLRHAHNRFVVAKIDIEKSLPVHPATKI
jgi:type I restriction enzyme M protein